MKSKLYFVYILTNDKNRMFYTGLTDDNIRRNAEHKWGLYNGFTKKYSVHKLVYYETHDDHEKAAHREQLIKRWKRQYKINVIEKMNPMWEDLFYKLIGEPDPATSAGFI
jgi:putative endonuclease